MAGRQDDELDIRLLTTEEIVESKGSRQARARAATFGEVLSSSYTTFEDRPVLWAFSMQPSAEPHLIILAGGETFPGDLLLRIAEDEAFTGMLYGKALIHASSEPLEPHVVVRLLEQPAQASWLADSFYVAKERLRGMRDVDLLAVALHASETGLDEDAAEAAVRSRTPELISSPDPLAMHPAFQPWLKVVRCLRRLRRLREIDAPSIIIDNDVRTAKQTFAERLRGKSLPPWPDDLHALVDELDLMGDR